MYVPPAGAGKICSLIQRCRKDYHRTTKAIQDEKYFTDLSKESDSLEIRNYVRRKYRMNANVHFFLHKSEQKKKLLNTSIKDEKLNVSYVLCI